jgi:uncharacterized protein (UPF0276 family)
MPEPEFAAATLPLFADGLVDVVEWSFDMGWGPAPIPEWLDAVLAEYSDAGRLDGHGVSYSLLSRHPRQEAWLAHLDRELRRRSYRRVSEHVGFMAAGPYRRSTPLPMPHHPDVVRLGRLQLERLSEKVGAAVGLENLATALTVGDASGQGALCDDLLEPSDGWMVLDLHNLWCQAANFGLDPGALVDAYPLDRVRELHLSGGSWWSPSGSTRQIRRDTHDAPVPEEVLSWVGSVLPRCPNVDTVILERLGWTIADDAAAEELRESFRRIRTLCGADT